MRDGAGVLPEPKLPARAAQLTAELPLNAFPELRNSPVGVLVVFARVAEEPDNFR